VYNNAQNHEIIPKRDILSSSCAKELFAPCRPLAMMGKCAKFHHVLMHLGAPSIKPFIWVKNVPDDDFRGVLLMEGRKRGR
jgi:hypothetical protein